MPDPGLAQAIQTYGWAAILAWFAVEKVWPWFSNRFIPERARREQAERERLARLEERQVQAFEATASAVQSVAQAVACIERRLEHIESSQASHDHRQSEHDTYVRQSMAALIERAKRKVQGNANESP